MKKVWRIWSKRYSPARGDYFQAERIINPEDAQAWLDVFYKDEPTIMFVASPTKPPVR